MRKKRGGKTQDSISKQLLLIPRLPICPLHAYNLADVAGSLRKALRDIYMGDCLSLRSVAATIKWVQVMNKERSLSGSWFWRFLGSRVLAGLSCGEGRRERTQRSLVQAIYYSRN